MNLRHPLRVATLGVTLLLPVSAQYAERPALAGSGLPGVDVSGRSIKNPRVRAVHSDDSTQAGTTAWFFEKDPFLGYQLGRNLSFREFRLRDGVFNAAISLLGGPMPDGTTAKITTRNQVSCSGCHNLPAGNPGGGPNFSKDSGRGRNSPHFYGAGIVEMLALQTRAKILQVADANSDGWISGAEAANGPADILVTPSVGAQPIHFGDCHLSNGLTGRPSLNNIFKIWYVDANGAQVQGATEVDGVTTFGYNFSMIVWGFGQGPGRSALNPTNRAFVWDPLVSHGGIEAHDPSTLDDPEGDGVSRATLAGAIQFPASHRAPDAGTTLDPRGFSRDDPDGDGYMTEFSEGDLDLAEWFMLNAPRPAFTGSADEYDAGLAAMQAVGCTSCHVSDWDIEPADATLAGDRRFFDLAVAWSPQHRRLEGKLERLYTKVGSSYVRNLDGFHVEAFFSDLAHHDMGEGFQEIDFGGNLNRIWRTTPLWGVASSAPYGHDGASLTLRDAIMRHEGEGLASRNAFLGSPPQLQRDVMTLLNHLELYDIESLPTDVNGNGVIKDHFVVAGVDTGVERFNAEWFFRAAVQIQGPFVNTDGVTITSYAAVNLAEAYGLDLEYRKDTDLDGWPDVWDRAPTQPGFKDGVN